jgi:malate dehydrogenase (oxaloacetate-decarboxylating)
MGSPTAAFSIELKITLPNTPGTLATVATAIGEAGGNISGLDGFQAKGREVTERVVVDCSSESHARSVVDAVQGIDGVVIHSWFDRTFALHEGGKLETTALAPLRDVDDLSMAYTPGVARVCMAIYHEPDLVREYTIKKNTVAIVSDGTAVLGLGDIGPEAALPVMEGKAVLFKQFAGVDAFPVCLDVDTIEDLIETVVRIAPAFGGINLEDIAAPGAFEIEDALRERLDIPVFHDDQHGTAVVTVAALRNALKITGKQMDQIAVVIAGVGAAGVAVARMLIDGGVGEIVGVDRTGAVHEGRDDLNPAKRWFAENTNPHAKSGSISDVMVGADVFIGVSGPDLITPDDLRSMADGPIVFAMANPDPEIRPEDAAGLTAVMATGRSDYPNQINNVLAFPGIFRGALDVGATAITEGMKAAAAEAIAACVPEDELSADFIIPSVFEPAVAERVASAVAAAAIADQVATISK